MKHDSTEPEYFDAFVITRFWTNKFILMLFFVLTAGILFGCKKNNDAITNTNDNNHVDEPPTAAEFEKLMDDGLKSKLQTVSYNVSEGKYVYTSPKGTSVIIDGICLAKQNGESVNGAVTLEFYEAYDRSDMIVANKPTMGITPAGNMQLLESGGEFYVSVKQNGEELTSTCSAVEIAAPASNSGGVKSGMSAWTGGMVNGVFSWMQSSAIDFRVTNDSRGEVVYYLKMPAFGWSNIDSIVTINRPTQITCSLPDGYSYMNSAVYVLAKSLPNAVGYTYGDWSEGLESYLVFVTGKDDQYRWIIKEATIRKDHSETFDINQARTGSRSDFAEAIKSLR